eukprot:3047062-Pleurochrysis_carterae.AAC.3
MQAGAATAAVWTGPRPRAFALDRLAGSLMMSDTCNAARATKRRLAAIVEAAAKDSTGADRWESMSAAEQTAAAH